MTVGSLAAGGYIGVEFGFEFGPVEPERRDGVVQIGAVPGISEFTRQREGSSSQVGPDPVKLIEVLHRDDRSDRATVSLDDDVLTTLSVLDQARDAATGGRGDGQGPLVVYVSESDHIENYTENCTEKQ